MRKLLSILLIATLLFGCSSTSKHKSDITSGKNALSKRDIKEIEEGGRIDKEIVTHFYIYSEPNINKYVTNIGQKLAFYSKRNNLPYKFRILYDERIYATSAVGGYIYITTGFLDFLENESELAAVLAHEIAQCQYRHPHFAVWKKVLRVVRMIAFTVGGAFGYFGGLAAVGLGTLDALTDAKSKASRTPKADKLALEYMVKAGYDPQGMFDIFYKIQNIPVEDTFLVYDYDHSHPLNEKRVRKLNKYFDSMDLSGKELIVKREVYQQNIKGVKEIYQEL
jgi:predicted Zn-dependent protease